MGKFITFVDKRSSSQGPCCSDEDTREPDKLTFLNCGTYIIKQYRKEVSKQKSVLTEYQRIKRVNSNSPRGTARPLLMKLMILMVYAYNQEEQTPMKPISITKTILFFALSVLNNSE